MDKRILIWNQHWWTLGGGERYSATLAIKFAEAGNQVVIAGCIDDPRDDIKSRLGIDLTNVGFLAVADSWKLMTTLNGYDVFINGSHNTDIFPPPGILSILICHFPQSLQSHRRWVPKSVAKLFDFNHVRKYPQANSVWLGECGTIVLGEHDLSVEVLSGSLLISGNYQIEVKAGQQKELESNTWQRLVPDSNQRTVYRITGIDSASLGTLVEDRFTNPLQCAHNYDAIWSNSEFVHEWVARRWRVESETLNPPIANVILPKEDIEPDPYQIISVGRFFSPAQGHCKNQHLMIEAFRKLTANSSSPWKLVLVGSLSGEDTGYLSDVRRRASDLNVAIQIGVSSEQLEVEYARSAFYWHATGLGRSKSEPEAQEHFGITVVEAMARGLVPIVYDSAGPRNILQNWPHLRYSSVKELVNRQEALFDKDLEILRGEMRKESARYSEAEFGSQALHLLDKLIEK